MNAAAHERGRSRLLLVLKLLLTAVLLWLLVTRISLGRALELLGEAKLLPMVGALAIFILSVVAGAWQWGRLLKAMGIALGGRKLLELYWVGLFFNNFMPGNLGGDVVKVLDLSRDERDPVASATATLADRITGLSALALLALLAAWRLGADPELATLAHGVLLGSALFLLLALLFLLGPFFRPLRQLAERWGLLKPGGLPAHILDQLRRLRRRRRLLLQLFAFSLGVQALRVFVHYLVGRSLLGDASPAAGDFFLVIPPLAFALTLPITLGGLGLREGLALPLFAPLGVSGEGAVAIEFLAYLLMLAVSLLGGLLFLLRRGDRGARPSPGGPEGAP
jgi:uncharacterized membrane protein YbhN (UPF0104 family)